MMLVEVNYVAVIIAVVVYMAIGGIWYSPKFFGQIWVENMGYRPEELTGHAKAWLGSIANAVVMAFVLAVFIHYFGESNEKTAYNGACVGVLAWLGFVLPTQFSGVLWERRPLKVLFIHAGCMLLTLIIMGTIIGAM
ncbi:MAG: DUF1761 domain-containing protein [Waddliaceae bacterium]